MITYADIATMKNPATKISHKITLSTTIACLACLPLHANTWDGGGANGNTATAENWLGDTLPATTGESVTFGGSLQTTVNNDWLEQVTGITFASGAAAFSIGGDALTLAGGISNASSNAQTVAVDIAVSGSGSSRFVESNGGVETLISGDISGTELWLFRTNDSGIGVVTFSGNNTYTGQTVVGSSTRFNLGSATAAGNGATIRINTASSEFDNTSGGAITINNNLRFDRGGEFIGSDSIITTGGLLLRRNLTSSEAVTVSGSSLTIRNSFTNSDDSYTLAKSGAGALIFASDVVTPTSWAGGFLVTGGALIIDSDMSANTGSLSVNAGTVFGGSGSYGGAATLATDEPMQALEGPPGKIVCSRIAKRRQVAYAPKGGTRSSSSSETKSVARTVSATAAVAQDSAGSGA